jgi:hypothetical protein
MKVLIALVVVGIGVAIVIGLTGQSQSVAQRQFCDSLDSLNSSLQALTALDPATATQSEFESDASAVRNAWTDVKEQAAGLKDVNMNALDESWDAFANALQELPSTDSVSQAEQSIASAADGMQSTLAASLQSYDCTSS